ncbi:hypothetical protein [Streptomyces sp. NBC_01235]|uniref:hypothetical protein n=1 Tax=Streptomyces sp. NBC_01235 TaxID=2903788 RepID=UPI002E136598|nr:hypothetical protein OG289_04355 [Streptomyces sp. NBC_01235]
MMVQGLVAAVLTLALVTLAIASINETENVPSSGAMSGSASVPWESTPVDSLSLSDFAGGTWGDARGALEDGLDEGEVSVLDRATGLPLVFAYSGDPQRDEWTVCTAELTSGALDEPGRLVTVEIASPDDGCYTGSRRPQATSTDPYGEGTDTPAPEVGDDTADGTSDSVDSGPERGVRPGSWCGDPGAYGHTSAGTRMQCRYGAGNDYRWRRAG